MKRTLSYNIVLGTVLGALTLTSQASADIKSYHGSFCQPFIGGHESEFIRDEAGIIKHTSGTTFITCPIIRDRINSASTLDSVYAEGYLTNGLEGSLRCTLYSQGEDGSGGTIVDSDADTVFTSGAVQFGPLNVTSSSGNEGTYSLFCEIGNQDAFYHYYVREENGSD